MLFSLPDNPNIQQYQNKNSYIVGDFKNEDESSWGDIGTKPSIESSDLERSVGAASRSALRSPIDICEDIPTDAANGARKISVIDPFYYPLSYLNKSSSFGYRIHPVLGVSMLHAGVDYVMPSGSPIYSVYDGVVESNKYTGTGGNQLTVKHSINGKTFYTNYLHQVSPSFRSVGEKVKAGDVIGYVGSTGRSTGAHLHFEVQDSNKNHLEPVQWLEQFDPVYISDELC